MFEPTPEAPDVVVAATSEYVVDVPYVFGVTNVWKTEVTTLSRASVLQIVAYVELAVPDTDSLILCVGRSPWDTRSLSMCR